MHRLKDRDVVPGTIAESQTLNRYAYTNGNPISFIDPFGLARESAQSGHWGHIALDLFGLIPVVGEVADGINAIWYLAEGDYTNAAFSAGAMIPVVGYASNGAKYGSKITGSVKSYSSPNYAFATTSRPSPSHYSYKSTDTPLNSSATILSNVSRKNISIYKDKDLSGIDPRYLGRDDAIVVMPYVGKGKSNANSAGFKRDANYFFKELVKKNPSIFSEANLKKIESKENPIVDEHFSKNFPEFPYEEFKGQKLAHHHIGGGGETMPIPESLHRGFGGVHTVEKKHGIWGSFTIPN